MEARRRQPRKPLVRKQKSDSHSKAHPVLSTSMLIRVARRFEALSDPTRLRVLQAVCQGGGSVTEIANATALSVANVSRHLSRLRLESFVVRKASGTAAIYTIADETPEVLCAAICEHLAASDAQLANRDL